MNYLWGEIDEEAQHATNVIRPVMIAPASHITCHVPTMEVPVTDKRPPQE